MRRHIEVVLLIAAAFIWWSMLRGHNLLTTLQSEWSPGLPRRAAAGWQAVPVRPAPKPPAQAIPAGEPPTSSPLTATLTNTARPPTATLLIATTSAKGASPAAAPAVAGPATTEGCLVTSWGQVWKIDGVGVRSWLRFPTVGCKERALPWVEVEKLGAVVIGAKIEMDVRCSSTRSLDSIPRRLGDCPRLSRALQLCSPRGLWIETRHRRSMPKQTTAARAISSSSSRRPPHVNSAHA